MSITEGGEFLYFDAPKLHTLNGFLQVYGGINSLSLGALGETTVGSTQEVLPRCTRLSKPKASFTFGPS
ncbi:uncharacterized protein BDW70DRAFT_144622 [Aspergillus foveolatus]|uniref:uncharacterized protein n=1 Tax=Aspergillus foveolatus TaxID=210207 RepID=UPI003CCCA2A3